jgi:hypothetical protein
VSVFKFKWPALAVSTLATLLAFHDAGAGEKEPVKKAQASKLDLAPESLPKLFALIRPQANEWRHLQVHWITDVIAARRQAAKEDKPMVVLYTGGAGYNEPLGVC